MARIEIAEIEAKGFNVLNKGIVRDYISLRVSSTMVSERMDWSIKDLGRFENVTIAHVTNDCAYLEIR